MKTNGVDGRLTSVAGEDVSGDESSVEVEKVGTYLTT